MAAIVSGGLWLSEYSYKQKAPVTVENLSAAFTLAPEPTVTSATKASENWGDPVTNSTAATPADPDAHIVTQEDGLTNIYFGVDNDQADNLSAYDDLDLKIMLSETGENADVGWSGENHTITLVRDEQSVDNTAVFDNNSSGFGAGFSMDIVYKVFENTDNIISGNAPVNVEIPIEVWAEE